MHLIGIDAGGTRTTLGLADGGGREILRREGPPGIVDPRVPGEAIEVVAALVREALAEAGIRGPVAALCSGHAGVRSELEREAVRSALAREGVAERVVVVSDGEIALQGALSSDPGILLIAGTGSVAWGRGESGRVESCGGWGMVIGDEGSAYALGRAALVAAVRAEDGRGAETALTPLLLAALEMAELDPIRPWAGRAEKAEIAALAVHAVRAAREGDRVAEALLAAEADGLVAHARALLGELGPWSRAPGVVLHGGLGGDDHYRALVAARLDALDPPLSLRDAAADSVEGALDLARRAVA